ncbi:MAG: secretion system protein E [Thermoplasmata archaeon]|nr:MAG: secretion system protein E [Thermoplasmata archaeon]
MEDEYLKKKNLSNRKKLVTSSEVFFKNNKEETAREKETINVKDTSKSTKKTADHSKKNVDKISLLKDRVPKIHLKREVTKKKKNKPSLKIKKDKKQTKVEKTEPIKQSKTKRRLTVDDLKNLAREKEGLTKAWEEIDFYPLQEPFAYAYILRNKDTFDRHYLVVEYPLSENDSKFIDFIIETLQTMVVDTDEIDEKGVEGFLEQSVRKIIDEYMLDVEDPNGILYVLKRDLLDLGKLSPLMKDHLVEDISCDGAGIPVYVYHRTHGSIRSNVIFNDEDELSGFVIRLAQKCGKHISIAHPMQDATLPDGSRVQMTLSSEVTTRGSTFTIRKFRENPFSPVDIINFHTMSPEMVAYFWMAVEYGVNALISGGTASGKTSTLNAIALFIPREAKIVSIEETREINLPHPNWIPGVARSGFGDVVDGKLAGEIDMYDLMKAALRQRPEYILVGEIRGREAYVLFQAMATGHVTYSTIHADSIKSLIHRLEGEPINIPRIMLQSLDIVALQTIVRVKNKRGRRCTQIIEIIDIDPVTKEILTNEVFRWDPVQDKFTYSGKSYVLEKIRVEKNLSREEITQELKNRTLILEWMLQKNITSFKEVASIAASYREKPEDFMKKIGKEI